MKKLFFIAAITGAALVSCTKNELAPSATKQYELTFASPVTQVVTKADLAPATYPEGTPFAVYADHHFKNYASETNFTSYMRGTDSQGVVVSNTEESFTLDGKTFNNYWRPATKYYWPMQGYLTFAAYSPSSASEFVDDYSITNGVIMNYTTPDVAEQYDLMLSDRAVDQVRTSMVENVTDRENDTDPGVATEYDGVHIAFKHVLSAVSFAVRTKEDYLGTGTAAGGYKITLKSLTLKNAYSTGTLTQFASKNETAVNINNVWDDVTVENSDGYAVCSSDVTLSTTAKTWAGADDADLVMIPQALDHGEGESKVVAEIIYTVYHKDMGEEKNAITYTKSLPLATTNVATWAPSTRYLYTIIIGMEEIVFAPTVTNWADPTPIEIPESTVIPTPTV